MPGPFRHHVAIGDPQAPFSTVKAVLAAHRLLDGERLRADVQLVSIGDHFDWGPPEARREATADAFQLLEWLASHPADQVVLIAGNHDLARVCELWSFPDDATFTAARQEADEAYRRGEVDRDRQATFLQRHPSFPTAESLSRDFSCFSVAQRELVTQLLRTRRFRLAHEHHGLLLVHAGVTVDDLALVGLAADTAAGVAHGLNTFLDQRVANWRSGPLDLEPLHQSGDARRGEGRGVLFHRPVNPARAKPGQLDGPPRRRFDPRRLPPRLVQVVGHVRDKKCREELAGWCEPGSVDGPLRSLAVEGDVVRYQLGCLPDARMIFIDGGMLHARADDYELLDLDRRQPTSKDAISGT